MANLKTAFKGYLKKDVLLFLLLGLSCGVPFNLIGSTLSLRAKEAGLDLRTIGLFALIFLPYSFKFLWAPIIDCIRLPFLSKTSPKKAWAIVFQMMLFLSVCGLSFFSPTQNTLAVFWFSFAAAFFSASQDIVIDSLRIDTLKGDDLKEGSSLYQLGYRIGMLISGAGIIALSQYLSWAVCYQISISLVLLGMIAVLHLQDSSNKQIRKVNFKQLIFAPFSDFIHRHQNWLFLLTFIVLYKMCNAVLGRMAYQFYADIGFTKTQIALISSSLGTFITIGGVFLGGLLMVKMGYFKSLMYLGIVEILTSFAYALLALVGPNVYAFATVIVFDNTVGGMGGAVFVAFLSSLCSRTYSATQYALLASLTMFASSSLAATSGWIAEKTGWILFFMLTGIVMIPSLILLKKIMKGQK